MSTFGALTRATGTLRVGLAHEPRQGVPDHSFEAQDNQDSVRRVNEDSIRRDYNATRSAQIYRAFVPVSDMPQARLVEVEDGDPSSYSWEDLHMSRGRRVPVVKLLVHSNGRQDIADGNHRTRYWTDAGYDYIPAWVIDERGGVVIDEDDEE